MRHLKLYQTQSEYREHLADGGGLKKLPKVSFCKDKKKVKYNKKKAKKVWCGIESLDQPLITSTKGISSIKVNGNPMTDFVPYTLEEITCTYNEMLNLNTWEGDIYTTSAITNSEGVEETIYLLNAPKTDKFPNILTTPILQFIFDEEINIDDYYFMTYLGIPVMGEAMTQYKSLRQQMEITSGLTFENNTLSIDLTSGMSDLLGGNGEMLEEFGDLLTLYILPFNAKDPNATNFHTTFSVVEGTKIIYPTQEMIEDAPIYISDDKEVHVIEIELTFSDPNISMIMFVTMMANMYNAALAIDDSFYNGLQDTLVLTDSLNGSSTIDYKGINVTDDIVTLIPRTKLELPESITTINTNSFAKSKLKEIKMQDSVTTIAMGAFSGSSIQNIIIPNSVTSLGEGVFKSCDSLTSITVGNGITVIPESFAYDCFNLKEIVLGQNVGDITNNNSFYYCGQVTSITCYNSVCPTINNYAFSDLPKNGTLYIPRGADYTAWTDVLGNGWTVETFELDE